MRGVDIFSGAGGFSQSAQDVGINIVFAANHWPLAVETHAMNHPETEHACQDLRQADWSALPEFDLMLAAPACQGHSRASQPRRRGYHDALRATALAIVDCADVCTPSAIVVENVPDFTRWRLYGWWRDGLERLGYHLEEHFLVASHFGVAQRRRRLFIVATRPGVHVGELVPATTEPPFEPLLESVPDDAWKDISNASPSVQRRIAAGRDRHGERFLTQHTTGHQGVPLHEPIRTITTAPCHWNLVAGDRYRALTGRELARGMGFPDSFTWPDNLRIADVTRLLGNAVCPPVGAALLERVASAVA
jgi:DNA (cytosine-5)-methyltransferase 1